MFNLLQSYVGYPSAGLHHLCLASRSLVVCSSCVTSTPPLVDSFQCYPSADAIVILDAHTLRLVRVLAFWEAFPGTRYTKDFVNCISVDSTMKIVRSARFLSMYTSHHTYKIDSCVHEHPYRSLVSFWNPG